LTAADLAYYWASDIRFDTSGDNKAAIIMDQYTTGIIPKKFS